MTVKLPLPVIAALISLVKLPESRTPPALVILMVPGPSTKLPYEANGRKVPLLSTSCASVAVSVTLRNVPVLLLRLMLELLAPLTPALITPAVN